MEKQEPSIHSFFENQTGTWQYVVADPSTSAAVIIDPVLNYDPATQTITTSSADALLSWVQKNGLTVERILETHVHADHLTAASYLQNRLASTQGSRPLIGIGKRIESVQKLFSHRYGISKEEYEGAFDILFDDDEQFAIGNLTAVALHLPGHTPDHLGYKVGDNVFSGDSIFHTDIGTARCDFPGGSRHNLFDSGRKLLSMQPHVKIWMGHDYPAGDRSTPVPYMTVEDHLAGNKHLNKSVNKEEFVALRGERDASMSEPRLIHQSLQINIRAGRLPKENEAGYQLLHVPLKSLSAKW